MSTDRTSVAGELVKRLCEGAIVEQVDVSPQPSPVIVIRVRAPGGRVSWVSLCGAYAWADVGINATELKAGDRILTRIEAAKRAQGVTDRLAMQAARREGSTQ